MKQFEDLTKLLNDMLNDINNEANFEQSWLLERNQDLSNLNSSIVSHTILYNSDRDVDFSKVLDVETDHWRWK